MRKINLKIVLGLLVSLWLINSVQAQWLRNPSGEIAIVTKASENLYEIDLSAISNSVFEPYKTILEFEIGLTEYAKIISDEKEIGYVEFRGSTVEIAIYSKDSKELSSSLSLNSKIGDGPLQEASLFFESSQSKKECVAFDLMFDSEKPAIDIRFEGSSTLIVKYSDEEAVKNAMLNYMNPKNVRERIYQHMQEVAVQSKMARQFADEAEQCGIDATMVHPNYHEYINEPLDMGGRMMEYGVMTYVVPMWQHLSAKSVEFAEEVADVWEKDPLAAPGFVIVATGEGAWEMIKSIPGGLWDLTKNTAGSGWGIMKNTGCGYYHWLYENDREKAQLNLEQLEKRWVDFGVNALFVWMTVDGGVAFVNGAAPMAVAGAQTLKNIGKASLTTLDDIARGGMTPPLAVNLAGAGGRITVIPATMGSDGVLVALGSGTNASQTGIGLSQFSAASSFSAGSGAYKPKKIDLINSANETGPKSTRITKTNGEVIEGKITRLNENSEYVWMETKDGAFKIEMTEVASMEWRVMPQYVPKGSLIEFTEQTGRLKWKKWEQRTGRLISETDDMLVVEIEGQVKNIKKAKIQKPKVITDPFEPGYYHAVPRSNGEIEWLKIRKIVDEGNVKKVVLETGKKTVDKNDILYTTKLDDLVEFENTYTRVYEAEYKRVTDGWAAPGTSSDPTFVPFREKVRSHRDVHARVAEVAEKEAFALEGVSPGAKEGYLRKVTERNTQRRLANQESDLRLAELKLAEDKLKLTKNAELAAQKTYASALRDMHAKYRVEHPNYYGIYEEAYKKHAPPKPSPFREMLEAEKRVVDSYAHTAAIEEALQEIGAELPKKVIIGE